MSGEGLFYHFASLLSSGFQNSNAGMTEATFCTVSTSKRYRRTSHLGQSLASELETCFREKVCKDVGFIFKGLVAGKCLGARGNTLPIHGLAADIIWSAMTVPFCKNVPFL